MFVFSVFFAPILGEILTINFVLFPIVFIFIIALIMTIYRSFK